MNLAVLEYRFAVAEDEIDVSFDVAVREELARGFAVLLVLFASSAIGIECVLITEQTHVVKHRSIAGNAQRHCLRTLGIRNSWSAVIILKRDILGKKVFCIYIHCCCMRSAAVGGCVLIEHNNRLAWV